MEGLNDLLTASPELFLALSGMGLLMAGVYTNQQAVRAVSWMALGAFALSAVLLWTVVPTGAVVFNDLFIADPFGRLIKTLVLLGASAALLLSMDYAEREGMRRFEFPVLIVFATLGMMMMVSANGLIALYVGLELQSLALYVLAAFQRDSTRSTEAGLKYFVLGALSSGMLLYGCSLIYGFTGTTEFGALSTMFADGFEVSVGLVFGLVFLISGLAFKVSAVPFHMWTPDVYQGAPTAVTAFFAAAPKFAAMGLFVRVLIGPFGDLSAEWSQVIVLLAIASMVLAAFAAIGQSNIKRLMAYSSIGHVGYALIGLATATESGVNSLLVYMSIYLFMVIGTFACIMCMRQRGIMAEEITDLAGLSRNQPVLAFILAALMFSMAGIPPLAGFFGKLYVFLAAVEAGRYILAVIGVLSSVVAAYYYLRIVKIMYFDEPGDLFDRPIGREISVVLAVSAVVVLFFFVYPAPITAGARTAAASLFAG